MVRTYWQIVIFSSVLIVSFPSLSRADDFFSQDQTDKSAAINQQLDSVENRFSRSTDADGVAKEFSSTDPDVEKTFIDTSSSAAKESVQVQPARESPVTMLKKFLSPDMPNNFTPRSQSNVKTPVHTVDVAAEVFYYHYEEPNPVGVTNSGPMTGYDANYTYRPEELNALNNFLTNVYMLQARYAVSHDLEYKGSGIVKGKYDDAAEFRGLIGKDYFMGKNSRVTPYTGFGYRYLFDRGDGELSSTDAYGYDRKSHYFYLPMGGDIVWEMPHGWAIDFNAEYDVLLHGIQKSYVSDGDQFTGYNDPNITNSQDKGFGLRSSVKLIKRGSLFDLYVEPYIRYWNIEQSSVVTASIDGSVEQLVEPNNNTVEVGSKFGVEF